ncbi:Ig-like domain repeat protein [Methanosphaera sp. ISO3-F5]|uniref:Ig-like domain repeat protein n=1 Tax=Methanosphaera sp. ISO3-F5 TaxID=1452353 RepID=UPI002B25F379|nr:Ig-like domain repeat protein [Methanosphaera sp. ISO3-F5]WQH63705.1 hypothetical protein PXD04_08355 [Methanosphaera sp. ISO3-F5]
MKNKKLVLVALTIILLTCITAVNATDIQNNDTTPTTTVTTTHTTPTTTTIDTTPTQTSKQQALETNTTKTKAINKQTQQKTKEAAINDYTELYNTLTTSTDPELTVELNTDQTYTITQSILLNEAINKLTIEGNNAIIDGNNKYSFLVINHKCDLTINNLTLTHCLANNTILGNQYIDGAIYQKDGIITLKNSNFNNNKATSNLYLTGTVINFHGQKMNIEKSTFESNEINSKQLDNSGGAINFEGEGDYSNYILNITESNFTDNSIKSVSNRIDAYGGAICYWNNNGHNSLYITRSKFENNKIKTAGNAETESMINSYGGALYYKADVLDDVNISDSSFTSNGIVNGKETGELGNVNSYGGAIDLNYNSHNDGLDFTVVNNSFTDNSISNRKADGSLEVYGGALSIRYFNDFSSTNYVPVLNLSDNVFSHNTLNNFTESCGGAIYSNVLLNTVIFNTNFTDNHLLTVSSSSISAKGGAIFIENEKDNGRNSLTITKSKFNNNKITIYNSEDNSNSLKGGALYFNTNGLDDLNISDSSFSGNGIVNVNETTGEYSSGDFDSSGGAIDITFNNPDQRLVFTVVNNSFTDNGISNQKIIGSGIGYGGALSIKSTSPSSDVVPVFNLSDNVFSHNSLNNLMESYGGAVYSDALLNTFIYNSNFTVNSINTGNGQKASGGALALVGFINISNSNFHDNLIKASALDYDMYESDYYGGAVFIDKLKSYGYETESNDFVIEESNFTGNRIIANGLIDDLYVYGGAVFYENDAMISSDTSAMIINNSYFNDNTITVTYRYRVFTSGGAIYFNQMGASSVRLNIINSELDENHVKNVLVGESGEINSYGGALYCNVNNLDNVIISDSSFTDNSIVDVNNSEYGSYVGESSGGAIDIKYGSYNEGLVITVVNNSFTDNGISNQKTLGSGIGYGGALSIKSTSPSSDVVPVFNLSDNVFSHNSLNNFRESSGGAVYSDGLLNMFIFNSNFTLNSINTGNGQKASGGALTFEGFINISNSNFQDNFIKASALEGMSDSKYYGGAVSIDKINSYGYETESNDFVIEESNFTGNRIIANCIIDNLYVYGGAIFYENSDMISSDTSAMIINNSYFNDNTITVTYRYRVFTSGGAIYFNQMGASSVRLNIINSELDENHVKNVHVGEYGEINSYGGALYCNVNNLDNVNISDSSFTDNSIVYVNNSEYGSYDGESSGGAIDIIARGFNPNAVFTVVNNSFINNGISNQKTIGAGTGYGGALSIRDYSNGDNVIVLNLSDNVFSHNSLNNFRKSYGGAVYVDAIENTESVFNMSIYNTNFTLNSINTENGEIANGGALSLSVYLDIKCSNFQDNIIRAKSEDNQCPYYDGGAIYIHNDNYETLVSIVNSSFVNNAIIIPKINDEGKARGGAISIKGIYDINLTNSNFTGNSITGQLNEAHGGAINLDTKGIITISDVKFDDNIINVKYERVENVSGGAINIYSYDYNQPFTFANISSSSFTRNTVRSEGLANEAYGGAIYVSGDSNSQFALSNSNFTSNSASIGNPNIEDAKNKVNGGAIYNRGLSTENFNLNNNEFRNNTPENFIVNSTNNIILDRNDEHIPGCATVEVYLDDEHLGTAKLTNEAGTPEIIDFPAKEGTHTYKLVITEDKENEHFKENIYYITYTLATSTDTTPTKITLAYDPNNIKMGDTVTITGNFTDNEGNKLDTSKVHLYVNDVEVTLTATEDGFKYEFVANTTNYYVLAVFDGNTTYQASMNKTSFNVTKRPTSITAERLSDDVENVAIKFTVKDTTSNNIIPEGIIVITDEEGNIIQSSKYDENTKNITITDLPSGTHTINVTYIGNNTYNMSTQELTVTVLPKTNITIEVLNHTKGNVVINYTVTKDGQPIGANVDVQIKLPNGTTVTRKTDNNGKISITDPTVTSGEHTTTATLPTSNEYIGTTSDKDVYVADDVQSLLDEIEELKTNITELKTNITNLEQELEEAKRNNTELKENITKLEQELGEAKQNITNLENNITELERALEANKTALENNITALQNNITALENNITALENNITALENAQDTIDKLTKDIENLTEALQNNITALENAREQIENLTEALNNNITALQEAERENQQLNNTVNNLTKELENANKTIENLTKDLEKAQDTIDELNETNKQLNDTVNNLTKQLEDANKTIQNITKELEDANNKIDNLTSQLEDANNKNKQLADELKETRDKVSELEKQLKDAQDTIKDLEDQLDKLNKTSKITVIPTNGTVEDNNVIVTLENKLGTPISNATVNVTNKDGQTIGNAKTDKDGIAVIPVNTKAGTEEITVTYPGNTNYTPVSKKINVTTTKNNVTVTVDPVEGIIGETITLTAHLTDKNGNPVSGGNLVFKLNGKTLRKDGSFNSTASPWKFTVKDGIVTVTINADLYLRNAKNLTASYSGSYKYNEAKSNTVTAQIKKRNARITVNTNPKVQEQYKTITFKAKIIDTTPNYKNKTIISEGNKVLFKINGKTIKDNKGKNVLVTVNSNATATYKYTVPAGMGGISKTGTVRDYTVEALLVSDNYYPDTRNTTTFNVERSPVTIELNKVTVNKNNKLSIKANIKDYKSNNVIGDNQVNIKINGKSYVNPKTNKTQNFKVTNGVVDLSGLQLSKDLKVKKVTIVTGARQAYFGGRNETSKIVRV